MNTVQSDTFIRYLDQLKYCRQDSRYSYNGTVLNCIVPFFSYHLFTGTTCISLPKKLQPWRGVACQGCGFFGEWLFLGAAYFRSARQEQDKYRKNYIKPKVLLCIFR